MGLNLAKYAFGVGSGKFLRFMVSERGIEANLEKVEAILDMPSPHSTNDMQKLASRMDALNHFVLRSTDKCLPFFKKCFTRPKAGMRSAIRHLLHSNSI